MTDQLDYKPSDQDRLLTITEVAEILRVPVGTLRYWRHLGTGPESFKLGRGIRYLRSEVQQWLNERRHGDGPRLA
jgi:excisionase family DNA binding protein